MATRNEALRITLEVDGDGKVNASVRGLEQSFTRFEGRVISLNQGLELLSRGYDLVASAGRQLLSFAQSAIEASNEQEDAVALLNATLRTTDQFTAGYSQRLQDLAGELQNTTKFGDETVLSIERQLLAFGAAPEQIERFTRAALDLATGLRGSGASSRDAEAAALLLGKALAGDFSTLSRYGIKVDETADKTRKLEQAVSQIEARFGGSAAAAADTFRGQLEQVKNLSGDLLEKIGDAAKATPELQAALAAVKDTMVSLQGAVEGAASSILSDFVGNAVSLAVDAVGGLAQLIDGIAISAELAVRAFQLWRDPIGTMEDVAERGLLPISDSIQRILAEADVFRDRFVRHLEDIKAKSKEQAATTTTENQRVGRSFEEITQGVEGYGAALDQVAPKAKAAGDAAKQAATETKGVYEQAQEQLGVLRGEYEIFGERFRLIETQVTVDGSQAVTELDRLGAKIEEVRSKLDAIDAGTIADAIARDAARGREIAAQRAAAAAGATGGSGGSGGGQSPQGFMAQLQAAGIGTVNFGGQRVFDPFQVYQRLRLETFQNPIVVPIEAEGSPRMPFTRYFVNYAPGILRQFAVSASGVGLRLATDLGREMDPLLRRAEALRAEATRFGTAMPQLGRVPQVLGSQPGAGLPSSRAENVQFFQAQVARERDVVTELRQVERQIALLIAEARAGVAETRRAAAASEATARETRSGFAVFRSGFTRFATAAIEDAVTRAEGTRGTLFNRSIG